MIKPGMIIALLVVCGLMAAALFVVTGDRPQPATKVAEGGKLLKDYNTDGITNITVKKKNVTVELKKKDKQWILASNKDRAAKTERVDALLDHVKSATTERNRPGNPKLFALDPEARTEVTLQRESGNTVLYVGKSVDYSSCFVQIDEKGPVCEVDKDLGADAGLRSEKDERILDPAYFYDLTIIKAASDDIIDVAIKKGHEVFRVQRVVPGKGPMQPKQEPGKDDPKPVWWLTEPEGEAANDSTLSSICSQIANLNAKAYADDVPEKEQGFDKPAAKVVVRMKDGAEHTMTFGKISGDDVMLSIVGRADRFKVFKYVFDALTKTEELKKKEEEKKEIENAATPPAHPAPSPTPSHVSAPAKASVPSPPPPAPVKKAVAVPPPPTKIEDETKPSLPPAVVKPPEQKVEEKK